MGHFAGDELQRRRPEQAEQELARATTLGQVRKAVLVVDRADMSTLDQSLILLPRYMSLESGMLEAVASLVAPADDSELIRAARRHCCAPALSFFSLPAIEARVFGERE